ncbi:MAG TPA: thioesterase domain-containing protein [Longimicrobium sp.]
MHLAVRLALLAVGVSGPILDAQECPRRAAQHIRPSLRERPLALAGEYAAPWEYACGRPLAVRVHQEGTELTAVTRAQPGCPQAQRVRWRGTLAPGQTSFPVQVARTGGGVMVPGTATVLDPCTLAIGIRGAAGTARYTRTDCPDGPQPLVVFVGGLLDDWNRNLHRVYCAYDAQWERTRKVYVLHTQALTDVRRQVLDRADGAPVVLIGHSYGANFAYELANALRGDGGVELLLTLDAVSGPAAPRTPLGPGAARRWINVYAGSGVGLSSCGLAGAVGGGWGSRPEADLDLRFPPDPAKDDPDDDHCKTEEMFLLPQVQGSLAGIAIRDD